VDNTKAIIIANGEAPSLKIIRYLQAKGFSRIIAADGGLLHCRKLRLVPDYIIGDFDSLKQSDLEHYRRTSKIIHIRRQSDTDLEKALKHALKIGIKELAVCGITGFRIDHTLSNISILLRYESKVKLWAISNDSIIIPISGKYSFNSAKNELISIYAFSRTARITTTGLKYPLHEATLSFGERESTSNRANAKKVTIAITKGKAILVRETKMVMAYDI
jgi:thiamine pyrophosphokinase